MAEKKQNADVVDLLKFIGSVMIFVMHFGIVNINEKVRFAQELLTRWAVPFFFIASAYFLYSGDCADEYERLKKYLKRISVLYLLWFIYNFPSFFAEKILLSSSRSLLSILLIFKNIVISSGFFASWYLGSSMFCAVLIYFLRKKFSDKTILIFSIIVQIFCVLTSVYGNIFTENMKSVIVFLEFPNNIFCGFFYFSMGLYISKNKDVLRKYSKKSLLIAAALSFIFYLCEIYLAKRLSLYYASDQGIFLIPLSVSIFAVAVNSTVKIKNAKALRKMSTIIYCGQGNIKCFTYVYALAFGGKSYAANVIICLSVMTLLILFVFFLQKKDVKFAKYMT